MSDDEIALKSYGTTPIAEDADAARTIRTLRLYFIRNLSDPSMVDLLDTQSFFVKACIVLLMSRDYAEAGTYQFVDGDLRIEDHVFAATFEALFRKHVLRDELKVSTDTCRRACVALHANMSVQYKTLCELDDVEDRTQVSKVTEVVLATFPFPKGLRLQFKAIILMAVTARMKRAAYDYFIHVGSLHAKNTVEAVLERAKPQFPPLQHPPKGFDEFYKETIDVHLPTLARLFSALAKKTDPIPHLKA